MTAELFTLSETLSYAIYLQQASVVIITDSKSALQHLARFASGPGGVLMCVLI